MVTIQGIGGLPEPKSDRTGKVRGERDAEVQASNASSGAAQASDDVAISSEARAAAELAKLIRVAQSTPDVRMDKVEAARESIARGDYKKPEVVAQVADRIMKYLS